MEFKLLAFLALLCLYVNESQSKIPLVLGGVFDIETKPGEENSASMIPIVTMAIRHVNSCPTLLTDYELQMEVKDVKCQSSHAIHAFTEFIRENKKKIMILGPGCSESAEPLAKAAPFYNLVQVAMASANPALSCKRDFATFIRTIPPEHFQNKGRVALVKHFKWGIVAVLREGLDTFQGLANDLLYRLKKAGIKVAAYETFSDDPDVQIDSIQQKDARVIFGMFSEKTARKVICKAYKKGFYGPKIVWILMAGGYRQQWENIIDTNCTREEIRKGLGNYLSTQALMIGADNDATIAMKTVQELWSEYEAELSATNSSQKEPNRYAAFAYDAVWTVALTLNKSIAALKLKNETKNMSLADFHYGNVAMRKVFMKLAKSVSFKGMSGFVQFYKNSDRLSLLVIDQHQGNEMKQVGSYCMKRKMILAQKGQTAKWEENKVPACSIKKVRVPQYISKSLVYTMDSLCAVGIFIALGLLFFNIKNKNIRYIKMSSPNMNNIIILGCIFLYTSGVLFGIDGEVVSGKAQARVCQASAWTASLGFTMAFGALFSKTWRVHRIFLNKTKKTVIRDSQLMGVVCVLLAIDASILATWQIVDPIYSRIVQHSKAINSLEDIAVYPYQSLCTSTHQTLWAGLLYGYKGFILLFGTYLAWETRKVHIPALNDSRQIGMAVYNVFIPCVIAIPVLNILKDHNDATYILSVLLCVFCTTLTQCLIFVPKILVILRSGGDLKEQETGHMSSSVTSSYDTKVLPDTVDPVP